MSSIFEHSLPSNRTLAGMLSQTWWVVTSSLVARKIKKDNPQEGSFDGIIFCGDAPFQGGACVRINPIKASYNVTHVNRRSLLSEAALSPSRQTHSISKVVIGAARVTLRSTPCPCAPPMTCLDSIPHFRDPTNTRVPQQQLSSQAVASRR